MLRRHGLSGQAAASFWSAGRKLLTASRRRGLEYSLMVEAQSGQQVGPVLSGSSHEINVMPQLLAAEHGKIYGHLHTHPIGSAFSDQDAAVLLSWPQLGVIVVAAVAGIWYAMSRLEGRSVADPVEVVAGFRSVLAELLDDPTIPRSERPHVIWTRIAVPLGLRYDRVGAPDP